MNLNTDLRESQQKIVSSLIHPVTGLPIPAAYLAMDLGTGKTATALAWSQKIKPRLNGKGILVLAPAALIYTTWPEEIQKWEVKDNFAILHGKDKKLALYSNAYYFIMNFEGLPWLYKELIDNQERIPFRALIVDEAAKLRSWSTKRWKIVSAFTNTFKYKLFLSGRPCPMSLLDLWAQYNILDGGISLFKKITQFTSAFCTYDPNTKKYLFKPEHSKVVYNQVKPITRLLKLRDCVDVPVEQYIQTKVALTKTLRTQYDEFKRDFKLQIDNAHDAIAITNAVLSNKLRQFLQGGVYYETENKLRLFKKLHELKLDMLETIISDTPEPILCGYHYKFERQLLSERFPEAVFIDGTTVLDKRKEIQDSWNAKKIPLLCCQAMSVGYGLNLQFGSHIIVWLAMPWSPDVYAQFNARLIRAGQTEIVLVYHIMIDNSIDNRVLGALQCRISNQKEFLDYLVMED